MKPLVVHYSFSGNTRMIAQAIAEAAGADILELRRADGGHASGLSVFFKGGREAVAGAQPALEPLSCNPAAYDFLFIGTPVWAFTYAPPLATFFSTVPLTGKRIDLFCCHGGMKGRTFTAMKRALKGNDIAGEIDFRDPLKHDPAAQAGRAKEWARGLVSCL